MRLEKPATSALARIFYIHANWTQADCSTICSHASQGKVLFGITTEIAFKKSILSGSYYKRQKDSSGGRDMPPDESKRMTGNKQTALLLVLRYRYNQFVVFSGWQTVSLRIG
jgi:hypothetical protein